MMNNYHKLQSRFKQFGGFRLLWAYTRMGVLPVVLRQGVKMLRGRTTRDDAYAVVRKDVSRKLVQTYSAFMKEQKEYYEQLNLTKERNNKVWTCWLQGFENAPELVWVCQASLTKYLPDREIIQLTYENYTDYVTLPDFIVQKYVRGQIPPALFSDLIRLEVLVKYGGTWMDASMLCTGQRDVEVTMDCDLFMYQTKGQGAYRFLGASNWFITACKNNRPLMVLRDVLYRYWRDYSVTLDYYMFHDFIYAIAQLYPEEIAAMPKRNRLMPLMLGQRMSDPYDEEWMQKLIDHVSFHKLCWRIDEGARNTKGNFYHVIINHII